MRPALSQRQRNKDNPVDLGVFSQTSLRHLKGVLGPENKIIEGGVGGGTYNTWFKVTLAKPGWIILTKAEPYPKYLQLSCYNLNLNPIEGRMIWDADSISVPDPDSPIGRYYPYFDHVMGAGSDLYNMYEAQRFDRGNSLYYPQQAGSYLICISATLNQIVNYNVGLVVEFTNEGPFLMRCEDYDIVFVGTEDGIELANTQVIVSPVTGDTTIGPNFNAFTEKLAEITPSGTTVTVEATGNFSNRATWWIGTATESGTDAIELEPTPGWVDTFHEHSLTEWKEAWARDHKETEKFPAFFVKLTNEP